MALFETRDSNINPEDLTLDFYLEGTPIRIGAKKSNLTGIDTYKIGPYNQSLGFGITSVDIDVKPNLQPIVNITFKDLYGNIVFNRDKEYGYDVLFQFPYPKFKLYVKGYVGKPVSFLLQVKSLKTSYVPSDGSYEIKAEFVPNVFGFFADIPYQFLFAVPELKGDGSQSIVELAKNGALIEQNITQSEDRYRTTSYRLDQLLLDPIGIAQAYNDGNLSLDAIDGDSNLNGLGFKRIFFNIDNINPKTNKPYSSIAKNSLEVFGRMILASINSKIKYSFSNPNTSINQSLIDNSLALVNNNIKIIKDASVAAGTKTSELLVDTQSIFNVMTRLAGDCAYILGYILEGGLKGLNSDSTRQENVDIFGLFYPLVETSQRNKGSLALQKPFDKATIEIEYVEKFVKALYEGKKITELAIEQAQNQDSGVAPVQEFTTDELIYKLTNAETAKRNPYVAYADEIIKNLIQRSGILNAGYQGYNSYAKNSNGERVIGQPVFEAEFENMKKSLYDLRGQEKEKLKSFCEGIIGLSFNNGNLKKNFSDKIKNGNSTYKDWLKSYMDRLPDAARDTNQFASVGNPPSPSSSSLKSVYTINNGIVYYSPKSLINAFNSITPGSNNLISSKNGTNNSEILAYVSDEQYVDALATQMEILVGKDRAADTKMYQQVANPDFFKWDSGFTLSDDKKKVFVNSAKLNTPGDLITESIVTRFVPDPQNPTATATKDCAAFKLLDELTVANNPKEYIIDFDDKEYRSTLKLFVDKIFTIVSKSDKELEDLAKQLAAQTNLSGVGSDPVITQTQTERPQVYRRDQNEIDAVYVQFHHICHAWISLVNLNGGDSLPEGTNITLRNDFEQAYRNVDKSKNFYLNFDFPLVSELESSTDVRKAIVNTDPLLENNNQTSTLNMMQNICQLNNFLLQPIPGGVVDDLEDLFVPQPVVDKETARGNNALSIIWAPTPENRYANNKGKLIYPENGFLNNISDSIQKPVAALRYGDPNNIIVKSVRAGTDDNKVTSESIQATSEVVNNSNQNKKKSFNCSMISILQGRSYKIGVELLGNAQIFPTMYLGIDGLPIFTGLYWVTEVQHKITPNSMETSVDALKMKFTGEKFVAIPPITQQRASQYNVVNTSRGGSSNSFVDYDLNYAFLQLVKDKKIKSPTELNDIVKEYTKNKYDNFVTWYNTEIAGKKQFSTNKIVESEFVNFWTNEIPKVWQNYGANGINFLEFVSIHSIIYADTNGKYEDLQMGVRLGKENYQYITDLTQKKDKLIKDVNNIADRWYSTYVQPSNQGTQTGSKVYTGDIIFISGKLTTRVSTHPTRQADLDDQVQRVKTASGNLKVIPIEYDAQDSVIIDTIKKNPSAIVIMFSAGARKAKVVTDQISDKTKIYVVEPYGITKNGKCTHDESTYANTNGVPAVNFFLGDECNVGLGVIDGASNSRSAGADHFQALNDSVSVITGIKPQQKSVSAKDKKNYIDGHFIRIAVILDTLYPEGVSTGSDIAIGQATGGQTVYDPSGIILQGAAGNNITLSYSGPQKTASNGIIGTEVIRNGKPVLIRTGFEPQFKRKKDPRQIILHSTVGWGYKNLARRTTEGTMAIDHPGGDVFGINYTTDWAGDYCIGIPEGIFSWHANDLNTYGIGIEICALYAFDRVGKTNTYTASNGISFNDVTFDANGKMITGKIEPQYQQYGKPPFGDIIPPLVKLPFKYDGSDVFMDLTDKQVQTTTALCLDIMKRRPAIAAAVRSQDIFSVYNWSAEPAPGSRVVAGKKSQKGYGIFTHASCAKIGSHTDPQPVPGIIKILKNIGMKGTVSTFYQNFM